MAASDSEAGEQPGDELDEIPVAGMLQLDDDDEALEDEDDDIQFDLPD